MFVNNCAYFQLHVANAPNSRNSYMYMYSRNSYMNRRPSWSELRFTVKILLEDKHVSHQVACTPGRRRDARSFNSRVSDPHG